MIRHQINNYIDKKNKYVILLYHRILDNEIDDPVNNYLLTDEFYEQIKFLNQNYEIIPFNKLEDRSKDKDIKIIITFDDGYKDNFINAFPLLKEKNLSAIFFVLVNYINSNKLIWDRLLCKLIVYSIFNKKVFKIVHNKKIIFNTNYRNNNFNIEIWKIIGFLKTLNINEINYIIDDIKNQIGYDHHNIIENECMNWNQLNILKNNDMIIGSHGLNHLSLANQDQITLKNEIIESKKIIEKNIKSECKNFSFPFGSNFDFNKKVIMECLNNGYDKCFLNIHGYNYLNDRNVCENRIVMHSGKKYKYLLG